MLRYGWNSTSYQILNPGIARWYGAGAGAVVGYVDTGRWLVAAGAPVCAERELAAVAHAFEQMAQEHGRHVCYFAAEQRLESLYRDSRTHARMQLGAQPAWRPVMLAEMLEARSSLRAQLSRARNKGVQVSRWPAERAERSTDLRRLLSEWLSARGLPSLHFLVEPDTLGVLHDRLTFVAERDGESVAFLVASPIAARNGWLIEQMVRGHAAVNGTVETLIHSAACEMAARGAVYVTLGLAPLARRTVPGGLREPLWLRAAFGWTRAHARRFYNFGGLEAFKDKFQPEVWEPVFAITDQPAASPGALYAIASAFTGGRPMGTVLAGLGRAVRQEVRWLVK